MNFLKLPRCYEFVFFSFLSFKHEVLMMIWGDVEFGIFKEENGTVDTDWFDEALVLNGIRDDALFSGSEGDAGGDRSRISHLVSG